MLTFTWILSVLSIVGAFVETLFDMVSKSVRMSNQLDVEECNMSMSNEQLMAIISAAVSQAVATAMAKLATAETAVADLPQVKEPDVCVDPSDIIPVSFDKGGDKTVVMNTVPRHEDPVTSTVAPVAVALFNADRTIASVERSDLVTAPISTRTFGQGPVNSSCNIGSCVAWASRSGKRQNYAIVMGVDSKGTPVVAPFNPESKTRTGRITRLTMDGRVSKLDSPKVECYWVGQEPATAPKKDALDRAIEAKVERSKPVSKPITATLLTGQPTLRAETEIVVFAKSDGSLSRSNGGLIHWVFPRSSNGKLALEGKHARNGQGCQSRLVKYSSLL